MPKYDVAVIGAGLGGLVAAALLSVQKKRTVIIEQGPSLSEALGVVEKNGFVFSARPSLSHGFEHGGVLQKFSTELGILQHTSVLSPCYQVALPDRRISVFAEYHETLEELNREFPDERDALARFYRAVGVSRARTAKNRVFAALARFRSAAGFMRTYGFSAELRAFFDIQALCFFQKPAADLSLAALLTLCDTPPCRLHGGFRKLGDDLSSVIRQHGGEIRYDEAFSELSSEGKRVSGVKTTQGNVEAGAILLNASPNEQGTTLFIGVHDEVVPTGMALDVLFLPDYSRPRDFFTLSLNGQEDGATAPAGLRALTASFRSPQRPSPDKQTLIKQLCVLVPFLEDYLVFAEEFSPAARLAILPPGMKLNSIRSQEKPGLLHRMSYKNAFVLYDNPEASLQVIEAALRYVEKSG